MLIRCECDNNTHAAVLMVTIQMYYVWMYYVLGVLRHSEYSRRQLAVSNLCTQHKAAMSAVSKDGWCYEKYKVGYGLSCNAPLTLTHQFNGCPFR